MPCPAWSKCHVLPNIVVRAWKELGVVTANQELGEDFEPAQNVANLELALDIVHLADLLLHVAADQHAELDHERGG